MNKFNYLIYMGRFQPPHAAHIQTIEHAAKQVCEKVIVFVGSACQPRTVKNPWTLDERTNMISHSLSEYARDKVIIQPLHDYLYNDQKWVTQVQNAVSNITNTQMLRTGMIGHDKDGSTYYLKMFPQWEFVDVGSIKSLNSTDIRNAYFTNVRENTIAMFEYNSREEEVPAGVLEYLSIFKLTPEYDQLVREYDFMRSYKKAWQNAPFPPTFVTVDAVVVQSGHVLLVRRRAEPGRGLLALPGGFLNQNETIETAVVRELYEEAKLKVPKPVLHGSIKDSKVFDHPNRSLRGRTITHTFLFELQPGPLPKAKGNDDVDRAGWIPLNVFQQMEDKIFEDHWHIVNYFLGKI